MQFSVSVLALAASILSVNADNAHSNLHRRTHARELAKRVSLIQANTKIQTLAANPSSTVVWEGTKANAPFTNTLVNNGTDDAKVYFWTDMNFALPITPYNPPQSAKVPELIVDLPAGSNKTVSFSNTFSGAYAAVYPDTGIGAGGEVEASWVEVTTSGQATVDTSFLPAMNSRFTSVSMDGCVSDISACSYQCKNGLNSCVNAEDVTVAACDLASFPNSNFAYVEGLWGIPGYTWNGGCTPKDKWTTTFSS